MILLKLSVGRKPPPEIKLMLKFKALKSLTSAILNKSKNIKLKDV